MLILLLMLLYEDKLTTNNRAKHFEQNDVHEQNKLKLCKNNLFEAQKKYFCSGQALITGHLS